MKEKHLLVLALILFGLVIYYSLFEAVAPPQQKNPVDPAAPLLPLRPGEVKKIEIKSSEGLELVSQWNGRSWELIKGKRTENWEGKLNSFIFDFLKTVEIDKFPAENSQLKNYGLDQPVFEVTLTDITEKTYCLLFGSHTPAGTSMYAKFTDSPNVIIVGALLNWEFAKIYNLFAPA